MDMVAGLVTDDAKSDDHMGQGDWVDIGSQMGGATLPVSSQANGNSANLGDLIKLFQGSPKANSNKAMKQPQGGLDLSSLIS